MLINFEMTIIHLKLVKFQKLNVFSRLTEIQHHNDNLFDFHTNIGDEEENLKECYINANLINLFDKFYNIVNKWKGEDDYSNLRSIKSNIWSFLQDNCLRKNVAIKKRTKEHWPKNVGKTMICGNNQVNQKRWNNITKRVLKVIQEGEERNVIQMQWCGWPDQGVLSSSYFDEIRELLNMMNEKLLTIINWIILIQCLSWKNWDFNYIIKFNDLSQRIQKHIGDDHQSYYTSYIMIELEDNPEFYRISTFGIVPRLREKRWV